jgi:hypothetical protein
MLGENPMQPHFHGRHFPWKLLLADIQFPIIGIDIFRTFTSWWIRQP